ncbi:MAG TPA: type I methionyl aminopeptidase, partial [Candidatus Paceibacterota bacterium]|nr:type I methionyl aminopeptidase [Candidatus Paceibacterota bacterium]
MITLKTQEEIEILKEGGRRLAVILRQVAELVKPGTETVILDDLALGLIRQGGDDPAFLNYRPSGSRLAYPASLCVSVNEE